MSQEVMLGKVKFRKRELNVVHVGTYRDGTPCVQAKMPEKPEDDTDLWATVTVCVEGACLEKDEFLVKTWSENEEITQAILEQGLFVDTGKRIPTGYVKASVWRRS